VFPGSSLPNAMVQLSPITEYGTGAGYEYEDTEILGFTHTNKGHWNLCNIPILPVSGNAKAPFKSSFSHNTESAFRVLRS
jgi:putative alpha-1,2-mannosidase